ncbi:dynamin family protein [Microcoleus sp. FACHB-SPT15]|uniref:dynamin family protein n=1 Tax=Microcoleus sp. FACHB-SPT15 TaxID=2692830 RepID=UPI0017862307|nr:dynamin family protein [Microcoleus sp. FACHB-SPT15]MBD1806938.1 dynamin family protein [Microcoleus sp. FACHB-SPT15]
MNTVLVSSESVDLLSRITGQKLTQRDLSPSLIFLAALITVLLGVMVADTQVTEDEKQRLVTTLYRFIPPDGHMRRLAHLMIKGVRENKVYAKTKELQTLTASLSEPERLLLISFGYEMSIADGEMDAREKKYLQIIANNLGIDPPYVAILEAGFSGQGTLDPSTLEEVQSLLDPARFHELDNVFIKAASNIVAALPTKPEHQAASQHRVTTYKELQYFQDNRQKLDSFCNQLFQISQNCAERDLLPNTLPEEIEKVSHKLQSQSFRVSVVGEFSQGKSTLLNALLGEEIQPARAIPCSGTVTVLKYGQQRRVICRYRDGREEEIVFEQYQEKAAISEEAALGSLTDELVESEIEEIIFEHPDLELCRTGVEIVDSPGLNEHPERTAITQQLIRGTDAVIFLVNASRPLTQGERDLIQDLKVQLNGGKADEPAANLFVAVNFMDLLRREKDRHDVRQRIERFVQGQNVITGENRVHFISAQAALDAILEGTEDDYLKAFRGFTQSIEKFLTVERGSLLIKQAVTKINGLIQSSLEGLHQAEKVLDGKLNISETERQKILEQIGEASGRDVTIRLMAEQLEKQSIQQATGAWVQWKKGLVERMTQKSKQWSSHHSHIWSQKQLIQDYAAQFASDIQKEINTWGNNQLKDEILKPNLKELDKGIRQELEALQYNLKLLDEQINTNFSQQLNFKISEIDSNFGGAGGFIGGIGAGGTLAAGLFILTGLGVVAVIIAAVATAVASSFGLGMLDVDGIHSKIKQKVCEIGLKKLEETKDKIEERFNEIISLAFSSRVEASDTMIRQIISCYETLLEQQEKAHKETLEQREAEKAWIAQKRQELEQLQKNVKAIVPS